MLQQQSIKSHYDMLFQFSDGKLLLKILLNVLYNTPEENQIKYILTDCKKMMHQYAKDFPKAPQVLDLKFLLFLDRLLYPS